MAILSFVVDIVLLSLATTVNLNNLTGGIMILLSFMLITDFSYISFCVLALASNSNKKTTANLGSVLQVGDSQYEPVCMKHFNPPKT